MGTAKSIIANTWSRLSLAGVFILMAANPAFAASGDTQRQPLAGGGLLVTLAIVYLSRRRAIGGWLLYFYVQLYLSLAISLIFIPQVISNLNPRQWDNSFLYPSVLYPVLVFPSGISGTPAILGPVNSTSKCTTSGLAEHLTGRLVVEALPGPIIELLDEKGYLRISVFMLGFIMQNREQIS
jgi:hypothetical protein